MIPWDETGSYGWNGPKFGQDLAAVIVSIEQLDLDTQGLAGLN